MSFPRSSRVALLASLAFASNLPAAPLFEVVELAMIDGTSGSLIDGSSGQSVNNAGTVVGSVTLQTGGSYGVTFQNGATAYIGTKNDSLRRYPNWITPGGLIGGSETSRGFLFQTNAYTMMASGTKINAVNDNGLFVGSSGNFAAWGSGTSFNLVLPVTGQPAFEGGILRAVNGAGQMVGEFNRAPSGVYKTGIYRNGGDPILIAPPGGYVSALPNDINASGAFAGQLFTESSGSNGFYCPGINQPLQELSSFVPTALADDGSMVGGTRLYQGGTLYQLSAIVNATGSGWTFEEAYDISPDGRFITGVGYKGAYRRGFLLRPPAATSLPQITATAKSGNILNVDFKGTPGITGWKFRGSTDLVTFPHDLTPALPSPSRPPETTEPS
ncbi:hypothetical protein [Luteolibacter luteus]|uniref:Uncharacterized protein n=1 Tax=Luteolibacter luteus TaxID=2728835 RepID=A0A858RHD9_9BACT|nr:hypothetical protein [Luteolibacter luteus]QJE96232.1 hypothetical protein HHL09_10705 [Luteolibacter luteus]